MRRILIAAARARHEEDERTVRLHGHIQAVMDAAEPILAANKRRGLDEDFREHLWDVRDDEDDFIDRPVEDIIAEICRELGIDPIVLPPANPADLPRAAAGGGPDHPLQGVDREARGADACNASEAAERVVAGASPTHPRPQPPQPRAVQAPPPEPEPEPPPRPAFELETTAPIPERSIVNWGGPPPDTG